MADELGLPKSSLLKAIKDLLPAEMRIAGDASDLLVQSCNQFVHLVSTQANAISEREKRSTISPADVVRALEELEFGPEYIDAVKAVWEEWKVDNKEHQHQKLVHKKSGPGGMTQQQLIELQQKLFEEARAATLSGPLPSMEPPAAPAAAAEQAAAAAGVTWQAPAQQQQQEQQPPQQQEQAPAADPMQQQQQQQQQGEGQAEEQPAPTATTGGDGAAAEPDDDDLADVEVGDVDSELVSS